MSCLANASMRLGVTSSEDVQVLVSNTLWCWAHWRNGGCDTLTGALAGTRFRSDGHTDGHTDGHARLRRFFPDLQWYVDTMVTLIERAGEFATKDVWHSTVQLVGPPPPAPGRVCTPGPGASVAT